MAQLMAQDVAQLLHVVVLVGKEQPRAQQAKKSRFSMRVIYEDADIAALYKPAHLLCHSDRTGDDSLVGQFVRYLEQRGEYDHESENGFAPAVANRLDRGTEGLVLAAKNRPALRALNEIIRQDMLRKEYICITVGRPPQGLHEAYLRHFEKENKVRVQLQAAPGYKKIITQVQVLRTCGPYSLCRIGLITGRTHQIRVHMKYIGHTLFNDERYGGHDILKGTTFTKYKQFVQNCFAICPRQALHAKTLGFVHPTTGEEMFFDSEIPSDMQQLIDRWRVYANTKEL